MHTLKKTLLLLLIAILVMPGLVVAQEKKATLIKDGSKVVVVSGSQRAQELFGQGYQLYTVPILGSSVPASGITWNLSQPITSSQTTITLSRITDLRGNALASTSLPAKIYLTIEPNNPSNTEGVVCPNSGFDAANKQFTSCTRGLAFSGTSEASVSANRLAHVAGAVVLISNWGQFYNNFVDLDTAQTIAGNKTLTGNTALSGITSLATTTISVTPNSGSSTAVANVAYVNSVAISGAPDGFIGVKGIFEMTSPADFGNRVGQGSTGAWLVAPNVLFSSTSPGTTQGVVTNASGKIDPSFIATSSSYTYNWGATHNFSGTSTFSGPSIFSGTVSGISGLASSSYVADFSTGSVSTSSNIIILGYLPTIIKLNYFIQGYLAGGTNKYSGRRGTAVYNSSGTLLYDNVLFSGTLTGDGGTPEALTAWSITPNGSTAPVSAGEATNTGAKRLNLSIVSASSTGFTIQKVCDSGPTPNGSLNCKANISYEVIK